MVQRTDPLVRIGGAVSAGVVLAAVAYLVSAGYEGSRQLVTRSAEGHSCDTPASLGWAYEAVNYDIALDRPAGRGTSTSPPGCPDHGFGSAGVAVVASDGVRIAGWFIPRTGSHTDPGPVVVLVHGWGGVDKSDMLRYATTLHDDFDLAIVDLRGNGRSDPGTMSLGNLEERDLRAFIDWVEREKRPTSIGVLGDSGGAAAAARLARTDLRIRALVLESPYARLATMLAQKLRNAGHPGLLPTVAAVEAGIALRTGVWPDADPIDVVPVLGRRPLAISYGTADDTNIPSVAGDLIYRTALAAGADVEVHPVLGASHGKVVDADPAAYRSWVVPFFERALRTSEPAGPVVVERHVERDVEGDRQAE